MPFKQNKPQNIIIAFVAKNISDPNLVPISGRYLSRVSG